MAEVRDLRLSVRIDETEKATIQRLTEQAGYKYPPQFFKKLIEQLGKTQAPFDVRDIIVPAKSRKANSKVVRQ